MQTDFEVSTEKSKFKLQGLLLHASLKNMRACLYRVQNRAPQVGIGLRIICGSYHLVFSNAGFRM